MTPATTNQLTRRTFLTRATCFGLLGLSTLKAIAARNQDPLDSLPKSAWQHARDNGLIMIHRPTPSHLSEHTSIAAGEPGPVLIVDGQVFAPDGRTPASGVIVYAYNTDVEGYYGVNHAEYPPRLHGWMKTNASGEFQLQTILPGHYPHAHVPAHVHFELWGPGYPPQWTEELRFKDDKFVTPEMLRESAARGEFANIQQISPTGDGILHCSYKIKMQRETNFH